MLNNDSIANIDGLIYEIKSFKACFSSLCLASLKKFTFFLSRDYEKVIRICLRFLKLFGANHNTNERRTKDFLTQREVNFFLTSEF